VKKNNEDLTSHPSPAKRGDCSPPSLAGKGVGGLGFFNPYFQARRTTTNSA